MNMNIHYPNNAYCICLDCRIISREATKIADWLSLELINMIMFGYDNPDPFVFPGLADKIYLHPIDLPNETAGG